MTSTGPLGITADLQEKRLYWVDRNAGTIESSLYNGSDQKVHFSGGIGRTYLGITTFKVHDLVFFLKSSHVTAHGSCMNMLIISSELIYN